ncbi:MAG: protein kinase [Acidobacteriota bacterium]
MKSESRVDQILQSVLKRAPSERAAYLSEVCGDDEQLHSEVLTLLESGQWDNTFKSTTVMQPGVDFWAHDPTALKPDEFVGPYRIKKILGRGGMGDVYLAEHTGQNREVALKLLPEDFLADQQRVQRFRLEARAVIGLNHPHIVTVYDIGVAESGYFISTEFVEGETLRGRMFHHRLTIAEAVEIAEQVASALAYAHEKGVIHRDIKPENIMLRPDGYVKVLDFGLAKMTEPRAPTTNGDTHRASTLTPLDTSPGIVLGTVQYMSPEQARGLAVDERTDVWSLGVVLYEMIAGRPAFEARSKNEIVAAILEREPMPVIRFAPEIPLELERIITRALRKDRDERYQVIKDFLIDLRNLGRELDHDNKIHRSKESSGRLHSETEAGLRLGTHTVEIAARQSSPAQVFSGWKSRVKALIAVLLLVVLGTVFYRVVLQRAFNRTPAFSSIKIARLTSTGKSRLVAISPDGKYVAHVVDDAGKQGLWNRQVASSVIAPIVPAAEIEYQGLSFSPDSNYVYYIAHEKGKAIRDLYQVSVLGGPVRKLIENVDTAVTFSPDGQRLSFVRRFSDRAEDTLIVANVDGTNEQRLVNRKQPDFFSMSGPSWSPDGKTIACGAGSSDTDGRFMNIVGVDVATGAEKPLTSKKWSGVGRVAWRGKDGDELVINALEQTLGLYQIWIVGLNSGAARRITNDLSDYRDLSLTADASVLAVTQSDQLSSLWNFESTAADAAQQVSSAKYDGYYGLDWKREGQIVYSSSTGGNQDIWQVESSGANPKPLTVDARSNVWPAVSPDGKYIVFTSDRSGTLHLWRIDRDGSNPVQLTNGGGEDWATFSPDGRWVIYTVTGGGDRFTLWKVSIDAGAPVRLTERLALQASISPDGKQIACGYRADVKSQWKIALFSLDGGAPKQTFEVPQSIDLPIVIRWTPDGRGITYIDTRNGVSNLWTQPVAGGPPRQLTNWTSQQVSAFAWSRDGKRVAVARGSRTDDIVLIRDSR